MVFVGVGYAAAVVACSDDATSTNTSTSTGTDGGSTSTSPQDSGTSTGDASSDSGIETTDRDSGPTTYTVGVTVTGLSGKGFSLKNGGDALAITADGKFTFATALADATTYEVTVGAQPTDPTQTCAVDQGKGTVAGANVDLKVTCTTNTYKVGGTASGIITTGLVLTNNGGDDLPVDASGKFTFLTSVASGATYAVAVKTNPQNQVCTVTAGTDTAKVVDADVTSVAVTCTTTVCATADEHGTATLTCPDGQTIATIDFASYGTPTGTCGGFATTDTCNATTSADIVKAACVGQATCSIAATNENFGDPCSGTFKHIDIQASCK
jgi:hypothetical protein